jgi:ketosteroid isomerase-like protein
MRQRNMLLIQSRCVISALIAAMMGFVLMTTGMSPAQAQTPAASAPTPAQIEAFHQELRELRNQISDAIVQRDVDKIFSMTTDDIVFTAMDNVPLHGVKEARAYYDKMMHGSESIVTDMKISFEPDSLSTLYDDGHVAISSGNSTAFFKLRAGLEFSAPLRWTATLVREHEKWKIASAHFSANMFDNPIEKTAEKNIWLIVGAVLVLGLLLGFVAGRLIHGFHAHGKGGIRSES